MPQSAQPTNAIVIILFLLLLFTTAFGGYYFFQHQNSKDLLSNPLRFSVDRERYLIDALQNVFETPTERPQIITLSDLSKLPQTPFFTLAKVDDIVFVFDKTKVAVLFRPSTHKIVTIVQTQDTSATPSAELR